MATLTTREGGINQRDLGLRQLYIGCAGILFDMLDAGRFRDREDRRLPRQKSKRDLARGCIVRLRDISKEATARVCLLGKSPCPNGLYAVTATRCCSHQGNTPYSIARSCK